MSDAIPATINAKAVRLTLATDQGKILPKAGEKNVLITSALPYVNNAPHLGNLIGSTMSADVFARYNRTRNRRTLYICGTDEYGTTTEFRAIKEGVTPKQLCDKYYAIHKAAYEWFGISFDHFGRTSTPQQTEICQDIFLKLYNNDELVEQSAIQLYCEKDQKFLSDRYVEGTCPKCSYAGAKGDQCESCANPLDPLELISPKCTLCGTQPETKETVHQSIRLDKLQERLEQWSKESIAKGKWSSNAVAMTNSWLRDGLKPRNITRDLEWGVPVPLKGWEKKVMYVWFDAPIGYPSITACYTDDWRQWWQNPDNVTLYQFMGKDNVPFHTLFFPGYLIGTKEKWTMLNSISTTEYLQYENTKFSKSAGVGVFAENAKDTGIPSEVWRYFLISKRPETGDSQFTWREFIADNNSELLNNLGNFVNRLVKFVNSQYDSVLPKSIKSRQSEQELKKDVDDLLEKYTAAMEDMKLRAGLEFVMAVSRRGNQYLQSSNLTNALLESDPDLCATVVVTATNLIYLLSVLLHPFMPTTEESILRQLNAPARSLPEAFSTEDILSGHRIGKAEYLFKKIKPEMEDVWRKQFGDKSSVPVDDAKKSKKKASKAAKAEERPAFTGPKTDELIEKEKAVAEQAEKVKTIKGGKAEGDVASEVTKLLQLKLELGEIVERLKAVQVTTAPE